VSWVAYHRQTPYRWEDGDRVRPLKLRYSLTVDDWVVAHELALSSPSVKVRINVWRWSLAIGLGLFGAWWWSDISRTATITVGVALAGIVLFGYPGYFRRQSRHLARQQYSAKDAVQFYVGERVMELTDEGVFSESFAGRQLVRWVGVKGIQQTKDHLSLEHHFGLPVPIPRTNLDAVETEAILKLAADRIADAQQNRHNGR
jgi:hypothetical protein